MDPAHRKILDLILEHGGRNVRDAKHTIYRFPNGKVFTMSKTPSDHRGWLNALSDLRKVLEVERERRPDWGVRREKVYQKKQEDNGEFNVELPSAGVHTPTVQEKVGVALGLRMSHQDLMETLKKIPDRQKYEPPRVHRTPRPRHGEVKTIPPEVLNEARYLSKLWGQDAGDKYIQDYIDEHWYGDVKKKEENKEESEAMGNPVNVLEGMVSNAKTNLKGLEDSIAVHDEQIKRHQQAMEQERAQVKEIQNFLSSLELVAEQAKAAAPALRRIMPVEAKQFTRLQRRGGGKRLGRPRGVMSEESLQLLEFAQQEFGSNPFSVAELWRRVKNHPEITISRTSAYSTLANAAIDKQNRPAVIDKIDAGTYRFKEGAVVRQRPEEGATLPVEATA